MDGVLANTHPLHRRAWRQLLFEKGRDVSEEDLQFVEEGHTLKEILIHFLGCLSPAEISSYGERKRQLFHQSASEICICAGVIDLIRELQSAGIVRAVATSGSRRRTQALLGTLGLAPYFSVVVTGDDVLQGKPDPTIFSLAAHLLGVTPQGCLVAEDSWAGVHAAKRAGTRCLAIAEGERAIRLSSEGADYVVPNLASISLQELQDLFRAPRVSADLSMARSYNPTRSYHRKRTKGTTICAG